MEKSYSTTASVPNSSAGGGVSSISNYDINFTDGAVVGIGSGSQKEQSDAMGAVVDLGGTSEKHFLYNSGEIQHWKSAVSTEFDAI